jgi:DNA (cytosine-5)-methyltransferase 1
MKKTLTFIDLFAGIGGFRLSLEKHGLRCVFSSEYDKKCQEVYAHNFGDKPSGDITQIKTSEIPNFDILTAGFPCQPFSYAGKLEGFEDKTRGTLFFDILRILKDKSPEMFLLENVKGIKSHDEGNTQNVVIDSLKKLGYTVYWDILNSVDFGLPQNRPRWFCVGFKEKIHFQFPKGNSKKTNLGNILEINNKDPKLKLSKFESDSIDFHFNQCPENNSNQIRVEHDNSKYAPQTKKGKYGVFSYLKPDKTLRFHVGDFAKTQIQEAYYCHKNSITNAILATRAPKLWKPKRHLSVSECKRLQGFPDSFEFPVVDSIAKKQLGNAISVNVVESIVEKMIESYKLKIPNTLSVSTF